MTCHRTSVVGQKKNEKKKKNTTWNVRQTVIQVLRAAFAWMPTAPWQTRATAQRRVAHTGLPSNVYTQWFHFLIVTALDSVFDRLTVKIYIYIYIYIFIYIYLYIYVYIGQKKPGSLVWGLVSIQIVLCLRNSVDVQERSTPEQR